MAQLRRDLTGTPRVGQVAQLSAGLQKRSQTLASPSHARHAPDGPIQRVRWHEATAPGLVRFASVTNSDTTTPISVSGYSFTGPQYGLPETDGKTKVDVITKIAATIGGIAHPPSSQFLSKSQLEGTLGLTASVPMAGLAAAMPSGNHRNIYTSQIDPHIIRAPGTADDGSRVVLHYQFGKDSYGYIVKIEQDGQAFAMHEDRGQDALLGAQQGKLKKRDISDPLMERFASAHDTGDSAESIAEVAAKPTKKEDFMVWDKKRGQSHDENVTKLAERSKRLDAVAKIGGEGPRWDCVRVQAQAGKLTNGSRFYCTEPHSGGRLIGITFQHLWGVWSTWFQMAFGIKDRTVAGVLITKHRDDDPLVESFTEDDVTEADYKLL